MLVPVSIALTESGSRCIHVYENVHALFIVVGLHYAGKDGWSTRDVPQLFTMTHDFSEIEFSLHDAHLVHKFDFVFVQNSFKRADVIFHDMLLDGAEAVLIDAAGVERALRHKTPGGSDDGVLSLVLSSLYYLLRALGDVTV